MPDFPGVVIDDIREKIDRAREEIGRNISVYTPTRNACVRCAASGFYDSISDKSISFTCPECSGFYWKKEFAETIINARVHWTSNEAIAVTPGGKYFSGDAYIHVVPEYHTLLQTAQNGGKVIIDEQEMSIIKINPVGAPVINRYRAILRGAGNQPQG